MIIFIDIDNTICYNLDQDYSKATPIKDNIKIANSLFDKGNTIVYWTARGSGTGIDWRDITISQFDEWGVKYHELRFGKPIYDIFIDDKAISSLTDIINDSI